MKRFSAIFLLFAYLTANITAFADRYDELYTYTDIFPKQGSVSADITLENFSDFEYLNIFNEYIAPYSMSSIVSGIANSKIHIDADYKIQKSKIIKAYIKVQMSSPVKMNDELSISADAVFHIWVNMDFIDRNKPYYKITVKTPMTDKYFIFDSTDENAVIFYPTSNRIKKLKKVIQESLRVNSRLTSENNIYTLSVDDAGFKNVLEYIADTSYNHLFLIANGNRDDTQKYNNFKEELPKAINRLKNIKLLGNSGISQKLIFNTEGKLCENELNLDLDTNIFKIYYAATGNTLPTDPNIPRPVINAKNSDLHMKINAKIIISDIYGEFSTPRISKDLAYNVFKPDDYSLEYTTDEQNPSPYEIISVINDGFLITDNGIPYIPLRKTLNALGVINENISWNDGAIEIIDDTAPVLPFDNISMSEGNNMVVSDGICTYLDAPLITVNSEIYIPEDFVQKILDATILGYSTVYNYEVQKYQTITEIERLKPVYYIQLKNSGLTVIN